MAKLQIERVPPNAHFAFISPSFITSAPNNAILNVPSQLTYRKFWVLYLNAGAGNTLIGDVTFELSGITQLALPYHMDNVSGFEILLGGLQHTPTGPTSTPGSDIIGISNGIGDRFFAGPIIVNVSCDRIRFLATRFAGAGGTFFMACLSQTPI